MNPTPKLWTLPQSEPSKSALQKQAALQKLLSNAEADLSLLNSLAQEFELCSFQLGELISENKRESSTQAVCAEQNETFFSLICQGQVRLLCAHPRKQRKVSAIVLEAGQGFGGDAAFGQSSLPYQAIAASAGTIARIRMTRLESWLARLPELRKFLQQQTSRLERLIFLKTSIALASENTASDLLTSHQVQQLLFFLEAVPLPAKTRLAESEACQSSYLWLRQGEIESQGGEGLPVRVGESWGDSQKTPHDWIAKTDLLIYKVSIEQWRAIAPTSSATVPAAASDRSTTPLRPLQPSLIQPTPEADSKPNDRNAVEVRFPKPQRRPWRSRFRRYPFIEQQSSSDCGVACLAMIGQYWGKRFSFNVLRELAKVGRSGASLKNLSAAAETVGFQARPVRASLSGLVEQKNPWVAHWQGDHYVVVYGIRGDQVLIADPACGRQTLSRHEFLGQWSGFALLLDSTDRLKTVKPEKRDLGRFVGVFWSYRSLLAQIILLSLLLQIFGLITPLFTQIILDRVVTQKSLPTLNVFAAGLLIFGVWRVGLVAVRQYLLDYFSNRLDLTLVAGFISHTLRLPLKFFESRQVGDILTRVQENRKIQVFLMRQAVSTWLDASMALVYLGLMFYYNWRLTLLVMALIPPIVLLTVGATPFLRQISRDVFTETAEQNSLLVEMLTGITTVKSVAAEREVRWRWEERMIGMLNAQFKGQKLSNGLQVAGGLINSVGSTALLWYGATLVIQDQLTIGQFVAFNMLIGSVINPVLSVVGLWDEFQEVLISVERLNDVFTVQPEETPGQSMLVLPPVRGEVQFEKVTFRYEQVEERNTLENISVKVEAGQTIAIVGRSGSGKSTLVKLLQGLYHPTQGRVWVDGHDVRHISPQSLRNQLGVVPQECFLFSGTILENIQLYRSEFSFEQVVEVAKLAEAHAFIQDLPLGYSTKVGERGSNLSGGQRQRIAIARALLGKPAILILDEATSSLDTESERRFQQNLARISRGRTTFIIAHRLSTVKNADHIWVLDRGSVIEQGTHDELVALRGVYGHLAQQQLDL